MDDHLKTAIERMKKGEEDGFNKVYAETYNRVYFRAKNLLKKEEDAQDLVQIVFVEAYKCISTLQASEALYSWLEGITYRQAMKVLRKKKDVLLTEEAEGLFDTLENNDTSTMPELTVEQKATSSIIMGIIEELPELQKTAVVAYYYDSFKVEQIAEMMECSVNTIKSRLNYARKYIKERVEEKERKEGYTLHVFGLPVLWFAIKALAEKTTLTIQTAQEIYNSCCVSVGLQATTLMTSAGAASSTAASSAATSSTAASGAAAGTTAGTSTAGTAAGVTARAVGGAVKAVGIGAKIAALGTASKVGLIAAAIAVAVIAAGSSIYVVYTKVLSEPDALPKVVEVDSEGIDVTEEEQSRQETDKTESTDGVREGEQEAGAAVSSEETVDIEPLVLSKEAQEQISAFVGSTYIYKVEFGNGDISGSPYIGGEDCSDAENCLWMVSHYIDAVWMGGSNNGKTYELPYNWSDALVTKQEMNDFFLYGLGIEIPSDFSYSYNWNGVEDPESPYLRIDNGKFISTFDMMQEGVVGQTAEVISQDGENVTVSGKFSIDYCDDTELKECSYKLTGVLSGHEEILGGITVQDCQVTEGTNMSGENSKAGKTLADIDLSGYTRMETSKENETYESDGFGTKFIQTDIPLYLRQVNNGYEGYWTLNGQEIYFSISSSGGEPDLVTDLDGNRLDVSMGLWFLDDYRTDGINVYTNLSDAEWQRDTPNYVYVMK